MAKPIEWLGEICKGQSCCFSFLLTLCCFFVPVRREQNQRGQSDQQNSALYTDIIIVYI